MKFTGEKHIKLQDAKYKLSENSNNETSIFIDKDLAENLGLKDNSILNFTLKKSNVIEALNYTFNFSKQLFTKDKILRLDKEWYQKELSLINDHFKKTDEYKCRVSLGTGNRYYLKELRQSLGFNIRDLLIQDHYILKFYREDDGRIFVQIIQTDLNIDKTSKVVYENTSLRPFAFEVFKIIYRDFGEEFLKRYSEEQNTRIADFEYVGVKFPKYFGNSKLLGIFDDEKVKAIHDSGNRFRYQKEPLKLYKNAPIFYFSTEFEYNRSNESHILFHDFKRFIEDYSHSKYSLRKNDEGIYQLLEVNVDLDSRELLFSVQNNLREFAFRSFKVVLEDVGESFLIDKKAFLERKHNEKSYKAVIFPDYFGSKKILGSFDSEQTEQTLKTGTSIRFNRENMKILGEKYIYFSYQWSHPIEDKSHPNFSELVAFIKDFGQNKYEIIYQEETKTYTLFELKSDKPVMSPIQKIFFGSPGSGKSYHIKSNYPGSWPRITFHPELDYQGFVGAYKPSVVRNPKGDTITYRFVEEAFIKAYCEAWKTVEPYYLIIEEINRGNCAQIFGDIFQLLDRGNDGFSEYPIICSPDVREHLAEKLADIARLSEYFEKSGSDDFSRMILPNNLNILCTMNTSDQSLFPMDSAFKRRWDWHYIPIDYDDAQKFKIDLESEGEFKWGDLIYEINQRIKDHTQSEDKQLGNRFVSSVDCRISKNQFVSKVVFYLWSEIYKDEHGTGNSVFTLEDENELTFSDFFDKGKVNLKVTRKFIEKFLPPASNETDKKSITENPKIPGEIDSDEQ
jgi:hypothetical protein